MCCSLVFDGISVSVQADPENPKGLADRERTPKTILPDSPNYRVCSVLCRPWGDRWNMRFVHHAIATRSGIEMKTLVEIDRELLRFSFNSGLLNIRRNMHRLLGFSVLALPLRCSDAKLWTS